METEAALRDGRGGCRVGERQSRVRWVLGGLILVIAAVLVVAKGGGKETVSGGITETKLVQAFVAASAAGGGCGTASGGCGPSGCK